MRSASSITIPIVFSLFALFNLGHADLPIHCLQKQVVGQWKLSITEPQTVEAPYHMNCGHENPDNPKNSYLALHDSFVPAQNFLVNLDSSSLVRADKSNGTWTMVYDEGMDIAFDNHRFTSFFHYYPNKDGKVMSYCGKTVVGWYVNVLTGKRACFRAEKVLEKGADNSSLYGEPLVQMTVVQPDDVLLQVSLSSRMTKAMRGREAPELHKGFTDHKYIVDKLNQIPGKLWKAKVYPEFEGKTLEELNIMAGRKKYGTSASGQRPTLQNSLLQISDTKELPKNFNWSSYVSPARSQGSCGSCYVFATIEMIQARLKIKYGKDVQLSPQHVLDCSFYNQGCAGGYPFLVEKYASEFDLVPESCSPYLGEKASCQRCDTKSLSEVYRVQNYKFLGGAYGKSTEKAMMEEIMANGPIVASFEPNNEFMYYGSGVFHGVQPDWVKMGEKAPTWERVDHSVLLYGWGETEEGEKYWLLLNSWGPEWGENGSFRIRRGYDESAIESMGEAADPIIIKKK